jgi:hypothetical protein
MTRHSLIRPLFVLGIRATFVGLAGSVAVPALAAGSAAPSHTRSSHPDFVAQNRVIQPAPIEAALNLLRWPRDQVPMIEVVEVRPPGVNVLAEGWVVFDVDGRARPTLYVAGWSRLYRAVLADRFDHPNTVRLAGVLVHERSHIDHGSNEELAYAAQLITLERLEAPPIDRTNVRRAWQAATRQPRERR